MIAKANILHHDVSLLNLLLVSSNTLEKDCSLEFLDGLPSVAYECLSRSSKKLPVEDSLLTGVMLYLLTLPIRTLQQPLLSVLPIKALTQTDLSVNTQHQSPVAPSSPLTSLSTPDEMPPTSPVVMPTLMNVASGLGENTVPVRCLMSDPKGSGNIQFIALSDLKYTDNITLSMGGAPLPDPNRPSIDTNPLYRTVS